MVHDADKTNIVLYYSLSVLCLPFIAFFIFILMARTPKVMRTYRNTLLNMMFWYVISLTTYGIFMQPVYAWDGCVYMYGVGSWLGKAGIYCSLFAIMIAVLNCGTSIVLCFYFRYVTLAHPKMLHSGNHMRSVVVILVIYSLDTIVALIIGSVLYLFADIDERNMTLCVDPSNDVFVAVCGLFVALYIVLHVSVAVVLIILSIRILHRRKPTMSAHTYQLQKTLTLNLFILVIPPILLDAVPIAVAAIAIVVKSDSLYEILSLASHVPFIEVIIVCGFTIWFVKPYRLAVVRIFVKKKRDENRLFDTRASMVFRD